MTQTPPNGMVFAGLFRTREGFPMSRKWFIIANGLGLLLVGIALANMLRIQHGFSGSLLWPAGLLLLHGAAVLLLLRARKKRLIRLTGILSGLVAAVSGWAAFATVGAPAPRWLGLLGLVCFIAGPVILIANLCATLFVRQEKA